MNVRAWVDRLTSPEAKAMLRTAAHLVLDFVGDDRAGSAGSDGAVSASSDAAAKVAVAATAGIAEKIFSAATRAPKTPSHRRGGKIALGIAVGAAVIGGAVWLASPKGRAKAREMWHAARGWRKPRSKNGVPVEVPPPV